MYRDCPFFHALIDNIEMVLAKTDLIVGERYFELGRQVHSSGVLASRIREEYLRTRQALLRVKRQKKLLERDNARRQSLQLRNLYLDPIHFIQIHFLRELHATRPRSGRTTKMLDLLRSSINVIASGVKNTG